MVLVRSLLAASAAVQCIGPVVAAPSNRGLVGRQDGLGGFLGGDNNDNSGASASSAQSQTGPSDPIGSAIDGIIQGGADALNTGKNIIDGGINAIGNLLGGSKDSSNDNEDSLSASTTASGFALPTASASAVANNTASPLAASLTNANGQVLITGGWAPIKSGPVPVRVEIRDMIKDEISFSLYLLGLQKMQEAPVDDALSYFQLSCIHGEPKDHTWNKDQSKQQAFGYCHHNDAGFPTWHRPYMLAYEQGLYIHIQNIVRDWPSSDPDYEEIQQKAKTWRMPYWDWSMSNVDPIMPAEIGTMQTIKCKTPQGEKTIQNPLYTFRFPDDAASFLGQQDMQNYFPDGAIKRNYPDTINTALRAQRPSLQNEISKLYGSSNQAYDAFATKTSKASGSNIDPNAFGQGNWANTFSLEFIHDQVHGYVGTNGNTMANPAIASFDPVFWLHHTFVDKLFADWQQYKQDSVYVDDDVMNYPLVPFRKGDGNYYTNADVRSVLDLGYSYPSIKNSNIDGGDSGSNDNSDSGSDNSGSGSDSNSDSNSGSGSGSNSSSSSNSSSNSGNHNGGGKHGSTGGSDHSKDVEQIRHNYPGWLGALSGDNDSVFGDIKNVIDKIVKGNTYYEYSASIRIDTSKFEGPIDVYAYLENPKGNSNKHDITNYAYDDEFVGKYSTFSWVMGSSDGGFINAGIPLTGALLKEVSSDKLQDLIESNSVQDYLVKNFQYIIVDARTGDAIQDTTGCNVIITHCEVTIPGSTTEMPSYAPPKPVYTPKPAPTTKFVYNAPPAPKAYTPAPVPTAVSTHAAGSGSGAAATPAPSAGAGGSYGAPPAAPNTSNGTATVPGPTNAGLASFQTVFQASTHVAITLAISAIFFL